MRDMVPREPRSIRNIPVPQHSKHRDVPPVHSIEEDYMERPIRARRQKRGSHLFLIIGLLVIVVCGVGGLLLSTLFAGATVTVFPRQDKVQAPKTLIARINPPTGELGYQTMTVMRSASTSVPATGTHPVSRSASGVVTIYNAFSTESQRLIANTRFQSPDGKIYRLHDSVVVPGAIKNPDSSLTPGAFSVTIFADSPGPDYNRAETRYVIPGFKGDPRYTKFYATGPAMTGGFVGQEPAIAQADLDKATDALKQALTKAAQDSLTSQLPQNFVAIPGTLQVTFTPVSQTAGESGTATIAETATMSGAIIRGQDLAAAVAKETIQDYKGEAVALGDPNELSIASATSTQGNTLTLMLSGTPTVVWQFDPGVLKTALLGKNKANFQSIVESFAPAINKAEAKVRPFWQGSFPGDPKKIEVIVSDERTP
jgi:hypothetical protein